MNTLQIKTFRYKKHAAIVLSQKNATLLAKIGKYEFQKITANVHHSKRDFNEPKMNEYQISKIGKYEYQKITANVQHQGKWQYLKLLKRLLKNFGLKFKLKLKEENKRK